jgi:hypothetical protein
MIEKLRSDYGYKRIAIVDTDCHHGDGSQNIYWHDPQTLFISIHQDGRTLYPGSGAFSELGGPQAWGSTVNIPLPPETGDQGFLLAIKKIVRPILDEWKPEIIINSAGQDNHFTDPITNMKLTARGYAEMSHLINPDIAVLEGGYAIEEALPYTNLAIILSMAGYDYGKVVESATLPPPTRPQVLDYIEKIADFIHDSRAKPMNPTLTGSVLKDGYWENTYSIFYDSHPADPKKTPNWPSHISELRQERLRDCLDCPGVLIIKSSSAVAKEKTFVWLPQNPCEKCKKIALNTMADEKIFS